MKNRKKCPFCKGGNISVREVRHHHSSFDDGEAAFCIECGAQGPIRLTHHLALDAWDFRDQKPQPKEISKMRPFGHLPRHELRPLLISLQAEYEKNLIDLPKQAINDPKLSGDRVVEILNKKSKEIEDVRKEIARR